MQDVRCTYTRLRSQDVQKTYWGSSKGLLHVQFTSCVQKVVFKCSSLSRFYFSIILYFQVGNNRKHWRKAKYWPSTGQETVSYFNASPNKLPVSKQTSSSAFPQKVSFNYWPQINLLRFWKMAYTRFSCARKLFTMNESF